MARGGYRPGAGRPKLTEEEKAKRAAEKPCGAPRLPTSKRLTNRQLVVVDAMRLALAEAAHCISDLRAAAIAEEKAAKAKDSLAYAKRLLARAIKTESVPESKLVEQKLLQLQVRRLASAMRSFGLNRPLSKEPPTRSDQ